MLFTHVIKDLTHLSQLFGTTSYVMNIGVGRHFEVGVLNRLVRACVRKGAGREERSATNGTGYISARGKSASSSLKSGDAIAPTAPTVPTPTMNVYYTCK